MKQEVNYNRIKSALEFIAANYKNQPGINEIADHINLSEFHFQRIFKEWAGKTPKKFLRFITFEEPKYKKAHSECKSFGFDFPLTIDTLTLIEVNETFTTCNNVCNFNLSS